MKKIHLVVAYGRNRIIGNNGVLPNWKLPADMKLFKTLTTGGIVIMGRKTYESFPQAYRPLPNRVNVIVTRNAAYQPSPTNNQTLVCTSLFEAIEWATLEDKEIFIIGGAEIYDQALNCLKAVNTIIATVVDGVFDGDTYFPALDEASWSRELIHRNGVDEKNSHAFTVSRLTKV